MSDLGTRLGDMQRRINTLEKRLATLEAQDRVGGFTAGSVLFASSTGGLTQDNSGLFFDDTNNRLGIGTTSPAKALDVVGDIDATGDIFNDGDLFPNSTANVRYSANSITLANNAVADIGINPNHFAMVFMIGGGVAAAFQLNGSLHTSTEIFDVSGVYSSTAGTASSWNVYWSAANSRYELENKRGGTATMRIWIFAAA